MRTTFALCHECNLLVCGRVYVTVRCPSVRPSVCLSVCPVCRPLQQRVAGLLQAGDIDRHRQQLGARQHGAQQHGGQQQLRTVSDTLSADVGSWIQTCSAGRQRRLQQRCRSLEAVPVSTTRLGRLGPISVDFRLRFDGNNVDAAEFRHRDRNNYQLNEIVTRA